MPYIDLVNEILENTIYPLGLQITGDGIHEVLPLSLANSVVTDLNDQKVPADISTEIKPDHLAPTSVTVAINIVQVNVEWQITYTDQWNVTNRLLGSRYYLEVLSNNQILTVGSLLEAAEIANGLDLGQVTQPLADFLHVLPTQCNVVKVSAGYEWQVVRQSQFTIKYPLDQQGINPIGLQTSGTTDELNANPEYLNTAAYDTLATAIYPWSLPFNLGREEAQIYLSHLRVQRTEVMEAFYKRTPFAALTDADIAREYLDLAIEESKIIDGTTTSAPSLSTPDPGVWNFWGLLQSGNDLADPSDSTAIHVTGEWDEVLKRVSVFLRQSSLTYKEVLELLGTYFINPPASITTPGGRLLAIVSIDAADPTTCDLSKLEIQVVDNAIATDGYTDEGIAGYIFDKQASDTTPLYRLNNKSSGDHFYTTSKSERDSAIATDGYTDEGIAGYIFDKQASDTTPLYRLNNKSSGDHFYTTSKSERDSAIATDGYTDEGIAGYIFDKQASDTTPLYRLNNKSSGDHFYTTSKSERDSAILDKKGKLKTIWNKVHRFVRLSRKLGWTMRDLDKAITAFAATNLNPDFLLQLSHVQRLGATLNVPVINMLAWWADIDTASYIDQLADKQPEVVSLYRQLFRNKAVIKPLDVAFTEDVKSLTGKISDHLPTLLAVFGISAAELSQLTTGTSAVLSNDNLNLVNLSKLYRVASLAKALKLSIREWLTVKALIEIDPFATTEATLQFAQKVKTIRASGFSIDELDYLLRHDFGPASVISPPEDAIAATLDDIRSELQKIATENTLHEDPEDPDGVMTDPSGELTRKKLALLNWDTELIEQVVATLNDSVTYESKPDTFLTGLVLPNDTDIYEVSLASLPIGFTFPGELTGLVSSVPKFLFTCDSGIPIESTTAGDISVEFHQKFKDNLIILPTPVSVTTLIPNTTWTVNGRYSVVKNGGILNVYDLNTLKLRASRLLSKTERDMLTASSTDIDFIKTTEDLFDLQDQLQGQITYEQVTYNNQSKGQLRFTGCMTNSRKIRLDTVSNDPRYQNALKELYAAPRNFIARYMRTFSIQDFATDLAVLPVSVPNALKSKVYFDTTADPKKLHFIGVMTDQQLSTLLALSTEPSYLAAVNRLFAQPYDFVETFLTDSATLFDKPTAPSKRFLIVLKELLPYLRKTLGERLVTQKMTETLQLEAKTTGGLLMKWVNSPTHPTQMSITEFLASFFAESNLNVKLTAVTFSDQFQTFTLLHKIAMFVIKFKITSGQLNWLFDNGPSGGWLDFNTLPVIPIAATGSSKGLFAGWERLVDLIQLRDALPLGELGLLKLFDLALGAVSTTVNADINAAKQAYLEALSQRTLWPIEELETLLGVRNDYSVTGLLGFEFPVAYKDERMLLQLLKCFSLMKRLGVLAKQLGVWGEAKQTSAEELGNAASIKNAVKAKYDDKQWLAVAKPLKDPLREKQRAALVAYVVKHPDPEKGQNWHDVNELYEYFLVDVEMDACMGTTRILQATNSVQLFIQRCLMNLEPKVALTPVEAKEWAQWRKWYRVWEANRKVLFYPENWIEPELRDDKSPFFQDLENELLQSDVTMDTAEDAFLHYLEKLDQVARLDIVGMYHQQEPGDDALQLGAVDILHVFGRTYTNPLIYFYRRLEDSVWSAWEKVDLDIEGNHLIPVEWNRRVYLFWPIFTDKADQPTKQQRADNDDPTKYWEIKFAWSEYKNNRWSPKRVSKDALRYNKSPSPIEQNDPNFIPQNLPDFSFKTGIAGDQLRIGCYGTIVDKVWVETGPPTPSGTTTPAEFIRTLDHNLHPDPYPARLIFTRDGNMLWKYEREKIKVELRNTADEILETLSLDDSGQVQLNDVDQDLRCYLASEKFTISKNQDSIVSEWDGNLIRDTLNVYVDLTQVIHSSVSQDLVGESTRPSQASVKFRLMQGIGEFRLDDCNGDLVAVPVAQVTNGIIPTELSPYPNTKFQSMQFVETSGEHPLLSAYFNFYLYPNPYVGQNPILSVTPGIFRLLAPHQDFQFTLQSPFFFQDGHRTYFVSRTEEAIRFAIFFHPHVCGFIKALNRDGILALLTLANQQLIDNPLEFDQYQPNTLVDSKSPKEDVDFEHAGAYSLYNWELFFHIPFLIAMQLSKNQRFEEAQKWFHYIFDPTATDSPNRPGDPGVERFWRVKPFYDAAMEPIQTLEALIKDADNMKEQIKEWQASPFKPHVIARLRVVAYMKAVVMHYIDNLIAWGDQLFRQDTIESINEATQLYILAAQILGKRPEDIPARAKAKSQTFNTLDNTGLDGLSNAVVEIESFLPPSVAPTAGTMVGKLLMPFFCITANDKLLGYWDTVADQLLKIRHCRNIDGVERSLPLFQPTIDPALLVRAAAAGVDIASALSDMNAALPHYRFNTMLQKATELCNDVKALGASLLSALEKKDGEELALLRSSHEIELLDAIREIKAQQIEEANNALEGLKKYQDVVTARQQYYLTRTFMNAFEDVHIALAASSLIPMSARVGAETLAAVLHLIPDIKTGTPTTIGATYGGDNVAPAVQAFGSAAGTTASIFNTMASLSSTLGGYQRRQEDWTYQADLATKELLQVTKQIAAAEIRLAISEHELDNHVLQIENAKEVDEYLRYQKFTNQELYSWMVGKISSIYFQGYQVAYDAAKRAERTYSYELGLKDSNFIQFGYWDSLKKGLLSGEQLHHDLKRMDMAYLDQNKREYEITKHISLNALDPISLLTLKETGECFVSLPEALFDMDYPGHYMRRVKSVSMTIPCVTGPYAGVNCTLTQHSSSIRHTNTLLAGKYARNGDRDDTRFTDSFGTIQSIVTSSGQNDSGLFEANMRDERYLPFEGEGAISSWRIQLSTQFNPFDYDTISDVVLHLRYTARDGGELLRQHATAELSAVVNSFMQTDGQQGLARIFSLRHEFPTEWYRFINPVPSNTEDQTLTMTLTRERFPFSFQDKNITTIESMNLFVKVKPDFADSYNDSTLKLSLVAGTVASSSELPLTSLNGLLRAEKSSGGPLGDWTLTAWLNGPPNIRLNPNAIHDILLVCRYTC